MFSELKYLGPLRKRTVCSLFKKMAKLSYLLYSVVVASFASGITVPEKRVTGGYVQNASGTASFTYYSGCGSPGTYSSLLLIVATLTLTSPVSSSLSITACGKSANGYTAAVNQLAFGSAPGLGAGDACGRCFAVTANQDPYSPNYTGPFKTIVVKVTDLCPIQGNQEWCGQTQSNPTNQHGTAMQYVCKLIQIRPCLN